MPTHIQSSSPGWKRGERRSASCTRLGSLPAGFMFELSREEIARMSQSVTSSADLKFPNRVHAFTEQGVAMLASGYRRLFPYRKLEVLTSTTEPNDDAQE